MDRRGVRIEEVINERLQTRTIEDDPWEIIRCLIEEGLFYLYTFETEKANPFFLRAMKCSER